MAKFITFGKGYLRFVAEILLFLALLGILLLIDFAIYLKLASVFLFILSLVAWFLWSFSKQQQDYRLLAEEQKRTGEKLRRLSELAVEFFRIPSIHDKLAEITPKLIHFFGEYFKSDAFLLFAKKGNVYQELLAHNVALPKRGRISV